MGGVFMKKFFIISVIGILLVALVGTFTIAKNHRYLTDRVIRLHVVANSDSQEDQQQKLQVRDGILAWLSRYADPTMTTDEAADWIQAQLPRLQTAAEEAAVAAGWEGEVTVSFEKEAFPTRDYDTFSLPAGVYQALRVNLGQAQGKNWWCVMYPPLCLDLATDAPVDDVLFGYGEEEINLIQNGRYTVKFKTLEVISHLFKKGR